MKVFKTQWFFNSVYPKLDEMLNNHPSYLLRIAAIRGLFVRNFNLFILIFQNAALGMQSAEVESKLVKDFKIGVNDPVCNVRFVTV